jgi:hypothetical protein
VPADPRVIECLLHSEPGRWVACEAPLHKGQALWGHGTPLGPCVADLCLTHSLGNLWRCRQVVEGQGKVSKGMQCLSLNDELCLQAGLPFPAKKRRPTNVQPEELLYAPVNNCLLKARYSLAQLTSSSFDALQSSTFFQKGKRCE